MFTPGVVPQTRLKIFGHIRESVKPRNAIDQRVGDPYFDAILSLVNFTRNVQSLSRHPHDSHGGAVDAYLGKVSDTPEIQIQPNILVCVGLGNIESCGIDASSGEMLRLGHGGP